MGKDGEEMTRRSAKGGEAAADSAEAIKTMPGEVLRAGAAFFRKRFWRGIFCTLAGAGLWGFSGACAQFLLSNYAITPAFITSARMLGAGALFLAVLMIAQRDKLFSMLRDSRTAMRLAVFGGVGLYLCQITYAIVIGYTNAGTATVLQCTGIAFVLLFTCAFLRRLPRLREAVGLAAALGSTWVIATQGDASTLALPLPGLVWGIANGLSVAFYIMFPKKLFAAWGSFAVTGLGMLAGGIAATVVWASGILDGQAGALPSMDATGWLVMAVIAVVGTFAAFALYLHGVSVVGSVKGSLLGAIEPVSATVCAAVWLGTAFTGADWVGFALMIAMIFLVTGERPKVGKPGL